MKKRRIYLAAGLFGIIASFPGQTAGVSAFIDAFIDALPLSRVNMSLAYLIGTILSAFVLTPAGRAYDRFGSRITGAVSAVALGFSLMLLTWAPALSERLAGFSLGGLVPPLSGSLAALVIMSAGFFLIRFWGQGMLSLVGRTMIMKWYDDRRGAANAVLSVGIPLSFSYAPQLVDAMIDRFGWQGSLTAIGWVTLTFVGVLALGVFRDPKSSEEIFEADGSSQASPAPRYSRMAALFDRGKQALRGIGLRRTSEPMRPEHQYTLSEALRTRSFWAFNLVVTLSSVLMTGFTFHVVAVMAESGVGRADALAVLFPAAVVSVSIQPLASILSDYMRLKYFAVVHGVAMAVFMFSLLILPITAAGYPVLIASKGIAMAMFGINHIVVWPRFYGTRNLGTISGFNTAWMVAGSALGPYAYSLFHDISGSFATIAWVFAPLCLLLGLGGFLADNPNRVSGGRPSEKAGSL